MIEVVNELRAMLAPPVEGVVPGDTTDLERRISALTEPSRRREADRLAFYRRCAEARTRLTEDVAKPAYWRLHARLPDFRTYHPVQFAPPRTFATRQSHYPGQGDWAGQIAAPGDINVRVTLGIMLRVDDLAGQSSVLALVHVNRYNQGRGLQVPVLEQTHDSVLGSAHFEAMLSEIANAFTAAIPETLKRVAQALEAERRESGRDVSQP
jgi:hypothetical protein